ncbi:MAG: AmmeMemoRadiSam system radical SAM enzyme [Armatimonadetes bacterium]|nr:AmmeMemoRadiSam system radical SAM enzyme [Armatimonadota bacterium]
MIEGMLYEKLGRGKVRCNICQVRCVIPDGKRGVCDTRLNRGGVLYTLIYGVTSSACVDPVEKKPLFHFHPGTQIFSAGTRGCNFKCPGCQNWQISHDSPEELGENMLKMSPEKSVHLAKQYECQGICWTYNDPSIWFEHTLDAAKEARKLGLYTAYVTNGYSTPEALDIIAPYLDAFRVDLKGFSRQSYKQITGLARYEGILEVTKRAKEELGMHVECVTNVTPTINDSEETLRGIASWIRKELGADVPWHVTRFYPYLDLSHIPPTPIRTMERAREIGLEEGLHFVYLGNVPGHPGEHTYCPSCGRCIIKRYGFALEEIQLKGDCCSFCGTRIPGIHMETIHQTSGSRRPIAIT